MFWGKIKEISRVVREVACEDIIVPDGRVRRISHTEALTSLADSIREHGVIEPLIVRRAESEFCRQYYAQNPQEKFSENDRFILIAGERRLRAAQIAGLATVPVVSVSAGEIDAAIIAIVENLHREDLSIFEEAAAIQSLISLTGMTQEVCAKKLSVSQSYIANKLRLLRLTEEERELILANHLTERHSRALLRFGDDEERMAVLRRMIEREMNVAQAEEYVEELLCAKSRHDEKLAQAKANENHRQKLIVRDIRLFYNSIDKAVDVIKKSGIPVESTRKEIDGGTLISILLPRKVS